MRDSEAAVEAAIGYAVGPHGRGIAYAQLTRSASPQLLRLTFRVAEAAPLTQRVGGYAALAGVARALRKRGCRHIRFVLGDPQLVEEVANRRELSEMLVLPWVRLRCVLNSLSGFSVQAGRTDDLTQRARAEVALNVAA